MNATDRIVDKLNPKTYPGPQVDLKRLYQGLHRAIAAEVELASLPAKPEPATIEFAESVLASISDLPSIAEDAITQLQAATHDRRQVSC